MSNSSDSELELGQRSQTRSEMTAPSQETQSNAKSPWDMMKSKQNKAFSKNYLQEMMDLNEPNADVLKSIQMSNKKRIPDDKSPGISKKVSFSEEVHKREFISSSTSGSSDEDEASKKDPKKNVKKGILKRRNINMEDSGSTSDEGSIQSYANQMRQRQVLEGQGSSKEPKKNNTLISKEKSKLAVSKKKRDENDGFYKNIKLKKEKIECVANKMISDSVLDINSESSGNEFIQNSKLNKISIKNIKKEKISSQSDSDNEDKDVVPNKKLKFNKNIKKESMSSQSDASSYDDEESNDKSRNSSSESDSDEIKKKVSLSQKNSKDTSSNDNFADEDQNNTSSNKERNSSLKKSLLVTNTSSKKKLKENDFSESESDTSKQFSSSSDKSSDEDEQNGKNVSSNKNKSLENNNTNDGINKKIKLRKNLIKNESLENGNDEELIGNVSTLAKICALNTKENPRSSNEFTKNPKNEFLKRKLINFAKMNNFLGIDSKTYNLSKEIRNGDEIFLAKIPKDLDPNNLVSAVINFEEESSMLEINENVYRINVIMDKNISNVLIDSSHTDDSFNTLSLKPNGLISVCKVNKIRKKGLKIKKYQQNEDIIEEPKNLKEQHLLLGHNYEDRINLDKWISNKLEGLITDFNKKRKRKSKSLNENIKSTQEENLDIFKLLDEHTDKKSSENDGYVNKKKKKKKLIEENQVPIKIKTEMEESIDIINLMMMENIKNDADETNVQKRIQTKSTHEEEDSSPAKRKRSKSLSKVNPEEVDDNILDDSLKNKSKKNKYSKTSLQHIVKQEMLSEDEFSLKKNKTEIVNSTMLSIKEDNSIFDNEESFIPKPTDSSLNNFIDGLVKEVEDKKKKRKRKSLSDIPETSFDLKKKKKSL